MAKKLNSFKLKTEILDYISDHSHFFQEGMIMYPDQACAMPGAYKDIEEDILNFDVLPDDVWIITYPKCGTTWTQEMVWLIANDLNYEGAKTDLVLRFPFLEYPGLDKKYNILFGIPEDNLLGSTKNQKPPRFIKSHLPVGLLPRKLWEVKPKIIYVMRNPKDVAVSFYNHYCILMGYTGTKEKFFEGFITDQISWGSYWGNVAPFWNKRHEPNILINTYEEMKNDLAAVVRRTAKFLGKNVPENEMDKLLSHLNFSNMKDNNFTNFSNMVGAIKKEHGVNQNAKFINSGKVGDYKEKMSTGWIHTFDDWIKQEKIKYGLNVDKEFPY